MLGMLSLSIVAVSAIFISILGVQFMSVSKRAESGYEHTNLNHGFRIKAVQ